MELKYEGLLEDWEIGIAVRLVSRFRNERRVLEREDFEDLIQECLTHWNRNRDKYDPLSHANRKTFMSRVLANKLEDLARNRSRDKRRAAYEAFSLDAPVRKDEPGRTFTDLIDDATAEVDPQEAIFLIPFRVRLMKALARLSHKERMLCHLRMDGLNMRETYEFMGVSKDTAYKMLKHIREVCEKERLRGYFR